MVFQPGPLRGYSDRHSESSDRSISLFHRLHRCRGGERHRCELPESRHPGLQDFGELVLRSDRGHGYVRVDWYTPDGLPTWGDGRLLILGSEGYIELRKYVDIGGRSGTNHLFMVNDAAPEYMDCSNQPLPYYAALLHDIEHRSETAMPQAHCFKVMELALQAQAQAVDLGLRT